MNKSFCTVVMAAVIVLAGSGCSRQNNSGTNGSADRTAQPGDRNANSGNSITPPTGPAPSREASGDTAGPASGSLERHQRGGGSIGTANDPTRPEAGAPANVDPRFAKRKNSAPGHKGSQSENAPDPSVPDPQGKQ